MYYRYNSEYFNGKFNNDGREDHDENYEEFFKKMPYYRNQLPYLSQMYYPMMYSYPMMWGMQKRDEEDVEDLESKNHAYDYRCKDCEDDEESKPVMNIPMNKNQIPVYGDDEEEEDVEDLESKNYDQDYRCENCGHEHKHEHDEHKHEHAHNCKGCAHYGHCMPMMNMPMYKNQVSACDEDLKDTYPKIYIMMYPMVKYHCDMMESRYGAMYCPGKSEMDNLCKDVCDNCEGHYRDDYDVSDDDDMRQRRRQDRRGGFEDLARILFIRDLLGRRRRRRKFHHGY